VSVVKFSSIPDAALRAGTPETLGTHTVDVCWPSAMSPLATFGASLLAISSLQQGVSVYAVSRRPGLRLRKLLNRHFYCVLHTPCGRYYTRVEFSLGFLPS